VSRAKRRLPALFGASAQSDDGVIKTEEVVVATITTSQHAPDPVGAAARRRSLRLLWWLPASPFVGFLAAEVLLSETWPLWQVVPLAVALASPFVLGAVYGIRAMRHGCKEAWVATVIHLAFAILALVLPISESLNT
jgi:hypothetical protein